MAADPTDPLSVACSHVDRNFSDSRGFLRCAAKPGEPCVHLPKREKTLPHHERYAAAGGVVPADDRVARMIATWLRKPGVRRFPSADACAAIAGAIERGEWRRG